MVCLTYIRDLSFALVAYMHLTLAPYLSQTTALKTLRLLSACCVQRILSGTTAVTLSAFDRKLPMLVSLAGAFHTAAYALRWAVFSLRMEVS